MRRIFIVLVLLTGLNSGCDSVQVAEPNDELEGIVRTVFSTSKIELGNALSDASNGDIYVAAYGEGSLGVTDGLFAKPYVLRIREDGTIASAAAIQGIDWGSTIGIKPMASGVNALVNVQEFQDQFRLSSLSRSIFSLADDGEIEEVLMEETVDRPERLIKTKGSNLLMISRLHTTGTRSRLVNLSGDGIILWEYDYPNDESIEVVSENDDGSYYLIGGVQSRDFYFRQLSSSGLELLTRHQFINTGPWIGPKFAIGYDRFVVAWVSHASNDSLSISVSSHSEIFFRSTTFTEKYVEGKRLSVDAVTVLPDGGVVFAWSTIQATGYQTLSEIVRLSLEGEVMWRRPFESTYNTAVIDEITATDDKRLVILGHVGPAGFSSESDIVVWQLGI